MANKKGANKAGGRIKGTPNKRTQQWELFIQFSLEGGLKKFQEELNKLSGKDYVNAFLNLLEFHKPKLQRTTLDTDPETNKGAQVILYIPDNGRSKGN